jgi:hypothetical protein
MFSVSAADDVHCLGPIMLTKFGDEIWIADGPQVSIAGFHYPTRMAVMRLKERDLFIWSPIQLTQALKTEVEALGSIRYLVEPNSLHHLFLPDWKQAFPQAKLFAPPGLREKRKDIAFDSDLADAANPEWAGEIDQVIVRGNLITKETVFFHVKSRTVLFTDLIQQIPETLLSGLWAVCAKLDLMMEREPSVPRKFRYTFFDRRAARGSLARILAWPAEKALMAHGTPIEKDARAFLGRAFQWLPG